MIEAMMMKTSSLLVFLYLFRLAHHPAIHGFTCTLSATPITPALNSPNPTH